MTFLHRNPWDDMMLFPTELGHWLDHWPITSTLHRYGANYPPVNLEISPEHYDYYVFIAGLTKDQIDLSIDQHSLNLSGEKPVLIPQDKTVNTLRAERTTGKFNRTIKLANDVNCDNINADYHNGVLHIQMLRQGKSDTTTVKIN